MFITRIHARLGAKTDECTHNVSYDWYTNVPWLPLQCWPKCKHSRNSVYYTWEGFCSLCGGGGQTIQINWFQCTHTQLASLYLLFVEDTTNQRLNTMQYCSLRHTYICTDACVHMCDCSLTGPTLHVHCTCMQRWIGAALCMGTYTIITMYMYIVRQEHVSDYLNHR